MPAKAIQGNQDRAHIVICPWETSQVGNMAAAPEQGQNKVPKKQFLSW